MPVPTPLWGHKGRVSVGPLGGGEGHLSGRGGAQDWGSRLSWQMSLSSTRSHQAPARAPVARGAVCRCPPSSSLRRGLAWAEGTLPARASLSHARGPKCQGGMQERAPLLKGLWYLPPAVRAASFSSPG